ncbi:Gfo/Idh/MocA family oxidoreductase [Streptomyces sp. NBC_00264]|uniref:Gfo/Idh/MocA family protein n=1 Tax=unclassified Streptomyces TaxID=2593676 RepID=UPI000F5BCAD7|nr:MULTISPECIES: Gfo/Idh/MocA family oxidoreductase [unclassified Streptomyces]WSG49422.1 Gfo/Idh/MocA family oxidoreductase [Streptomyces sp. NBC_01732]WSX00076.1 Gfo/Idh/MocA family oxidoreductase [Streptomyces sp. NBC_00987]MCX4398143.1 Gfo/Idh/MocA family oxidoreductase [Streptomyces sp. NBC_01767]MCX5099157.1 Gfo/Idh/MocA family oxidoreductase [Streptomyces sp. NBC_00439]MCX5158702.1 Gfo/Idh/MocA family oxidoreductase [Streptomyces sp. NBC_00305]
MKVGCIGLGDIAQKAYLPVLTTLPGVELHLQTRTPATLATVAEAHRIPAGQCHTGLESLIAQGLDAAFVHAPTDVHPEIVARLLEAGVATYVDKPLAYELAVSRRLVSLAEERGTSLAVGFNRRVAPGYAQCAEHPRELILMQKNRVGMPEDPRTMVLDDFIHVVDTLRFLAPGPVEHTVVRARIREGLMHHVVLQLSGDGFTAIGTMNRLSGSTEERLEVSGQDTKREVVNLAEVIDHKGQPSVRRRGDWVPVARQRGIEQSVLSFLDAVRAGKVLSAEDALRTHELCERVLLDLDCA